MKFYNTSIEAQRSRSYHGCWGPIYREDDIVAVKDEFELTITIKTYTQQGDKDIDMHKIKAKIERALNN